MADWAATAFPTRCTWLFRNHSRANSPFQGSNMRSMVAAIVQLLTKSLAARPHPPFHTFADFSRSVFFCFVAVLLYPFSVLIVSCIPERISRTYASGLSKSSAISETVFPFWNHFEIRYLS